jgi:hypothetical protein
MEEAGGSAIWSTALVLLGEIQQKILKKDRQFLGRDMNPGSAIHSILMFSVSFISKYIVTYTHIARKQPQVTTE